MIPNHQDPNPASSPCVMVIFGAGRYSKGTNPKLEMSGPAPGRFARGLRVSGVPDSHGAKGRGRRTH